MVANRAVIRDHRSLVTYIVHAGHPVPASPADEREMVRGAWYSGENLNQGVNRLAGEQDQWVEDVRLMARRMALLYHFVTSVLIEELGEAKAEGLMREAIWRYGWYCGEVVRDEVARQGMPLDEENFSSVSDLPSKGWGIEVVSADPDEKTVRVTSCPLAKVWKELKTPLARLYCTVDQAKYQAYNPRLTCTHVRNMLDGDPVCELRIVKQAGEDAKE